MSGSNVYNYVFHYTDHLGNIRVSYAYNTATSSLKILEENHYYPFGLKHTKYNTDSWQFISDPTGGYTTGVVLGRVDNSRNIYQYKYNGKEFQDELGLNMYGMDMRQYDPAIARWTVIDPVDHFSLSPYNAFDNNPVFWADPSGADSRTFYGEEAQYIVSQLQKKLGGRITENIQKDTSSNNKLDLKEFDALVNSKQKYQYKLIDDKKNIHQLSYSETIYSKNRTIKVFNILTNSMDEIEVTDYVTVTRNIQIKITEDGVEFITEIITNSGTTSILNMSNCTECNIKTSKQVVDGVDGNEDAKTLSNMIGNNLKVNPEFNLFNQPNTVLPPLVSSGSGYLSHKIGVKRVLPKILVAIDLAEGFDYFYKKINDYSGSSVDIELGKNGTIILSNYNFE